MEAQRQRERIKLIEIERKKKQVPHLITQMLAIQTIITIIQNTQITNEST